MWLISYYILSQPSVDSALKFCILFIMLYFIFTCMASAKFYRALSFHTYSTVSAFITKYCVSEHIALTIMSSHFSSVAFKVLGEFQKAFHKLSLPLPTLKCFQLFLAFISSSCYYDY